MGFDRLSTALYFVIICCPILSEIPLNNKLPDKIFNQGWNGAYVKLFSFSFFIYETVLKRVPYFCYNNE